MGGTYILPEQREAYADDFGGESDALRPGTSASWAKILNRLTQSVVRTVCPSGQIVKSVVPDPKSRFRLIHLCKPLTAVMNLTYFTAHRGSGSEIARLSGAGSHDPVTSGTFSPARTGAKLGRF